MAETLHTPRRWALLFLLAIGSMLFMNFMLQVLLRVQAGAPIGQAAAEVVIARDYWVQIAVMAIVFSVIWVLTARLIDRRPGRRIRTMRLIVTIGVLPYLLIAPYLIINAVLSGEWEGTHWFLVAMWVALLAILIAQWAVRPSPERREAIETGDFTRVQDERFQAVQGRSAVTTLNILVILLFVGGILYDVLVTRQWPFRSFVEIILIIVIWSIAGWWWNRKL